MIKTRVIPVLLVQDGLLKKRIKFKETRNYVQRVMEKYNVYRYILEKKPISMKNVFKNDPLF